MIPRFRKFSSSAFDSEWDRKIWLEGLNAGVNAGVNAVKPQDVFQPRDLFLTWPWPEQKHTAVTTSHHHYTFEHHLQRRTWTIFIRKLRRTVQSNLTSRFCGWCFIKARWEDWRQTNIFTVMLLLDGDVMRSSPRSPVAPPPSYLLCDYWRARSALWSVRSNGNVSVWARVRNISYIRVNGKEPGTDLI